MTEWHTIETAPAEELVLTKIDDERGTRNVQKLFLRGRLWWTDGGPDAMYVYYAPTHWARV
jgi:hypothetical protein